MAGVSDGCLAFVLLCFLKCFTRVEPDYPERLRPNSPSPANPEIISMAAGGIGTAETLALACYDVVGTGHCPVDSDIDLALLVWVR